MEEKQQRSCSRKASRILYLMFTVLDLELFHETAKRIKTLVHKYGGTGIVN